MSVELLDCMGNDLSVVNAARVSMDKTSMELCDKDINLLDYLARHMHWSPFAHTALTFRITLPIFAARQLMKSSVGITVNEVSRRYVTTTPQLLDITHFRRSAPSLKQGSSNQIIRCNLLARCLYRAAGTLSVWTYKVLLALGVCGEQARSVLPQSMLTTIIWTGSLAALHRVVSLRTDPHSQKELQAVVRQMARLALTRFPNAWYALEKAK